MSNKVYCDISISADGYLAGPGQTTDKPFGDGPVDRLHAWMIDTPDENQAEIDRVVAAGAFVMGRNMFGPIRGDWDPSWTGWWGEDPPYHAPVFVLTHHPRDPLTMQGGTTFTFVTDGIGAATVNQYLAAGLIDELRTHIAPSPWARANASSTASRRCTWSSSASGQRRSPPTSATACSTDSPQLGLVATGR
jgi:dihydrofolate reductase